MICYNSGLSYIKNFAVSELDRHIAKRRTFAIISHPDAGKTTLTEKLLLHGGAISLAGTVKGKKSSKHATSDWMALEKQRGISVTTSVMQFPYHEAVINLLDTPGHADFSEDTYRTLTAVDSALMVVDAAKGVEPRTIKLMEICRLRHTPILTFINKLDRESRDPLDLMDDIEKTLSIQCAPVTWPIGSGQSFQGIYHLIKDQVCLFEKGHGARVHDYRVIDGLNHPELEHMLGAEVIATLKEDIELVKGASHTFDRQAYLAGRQTPVYFGTALANFGVKEMLDDFVQVAPAPQMRAAQDRDVMPNEPEFSGFVFKIQANMDPNHRDRIAFLRVCSGQYEKGIKTHFVRTNKTMQLQNALTFMAGQREHLDCAYPGDIIGIHNHGGIQIGDTFTQGEPLKFKGIPNFAPELFRLARLKDPLKMKALQKGLEELSEEGATQMFKPVNSNQLILGAVGVLQFDVVAYRLAREYSVDCIYEPVNIACARWVSSSDVKALSVFKDRAADYLAMDGAGHLTYLAPTRVNLALAIERYPDIQFVETREH